jgi:hypothetical protein
MTLSLQLDEESSMFRPRILLALAGALALSFGARSASADVFTFDIGIGNAAVSPFPGPYATVTVNRTDSNDATITYTALSNGGFDYAIGHAQAIDLNVTDNGTISASAVGNGTGTFSGPNSSNVSTFGVFNTVFDNSDGANDVHTLVTVTLTGTGGLWSSAASVLTPNPDGFIAAAGIFVFQDGQVVTTGFAGNGSVVPEPSTMAIAGLGALGFIGYGLRRRLKK